MVGKAITTKIPLDLTAIDPTCGPDAKDVFSLKTALAARTNPGAPSISNVKAKICRWRDSLS